MVNAPAKPRVDWIDAVKGLTIILVIVSHTTYGTAAALNSAPYYFELLCEWAAPFRMPLFFLVAGLFAQKALRAPLRRFIDSKILHFVYFYLLWSTIQIGVKMALPHSSGWAVTYLDLLMIPLEPFGLMWFLYALMVFFAFMRLVRDVRPAIVITLALALYFVKLDTGWMMPNEFAHRFIFFAAGVYGAPHVLNAAQWAINNSKRATLTGLFLLIGVAELVFAGDTALRPIELIAGFAGATGTIMLVAILAARGWAKPLAYVGSHSLYVFLAFFLPMAVTRTILIKLGVADGDLVTLVTALTAVSTPLVAYSVLKGTPLAFFFARPEAMKLAPVTNLPSGTLPVAQA